LLIFSLRSKIRESELEEFMELVSALLFLFRTKTCIPNFLEQYSIFFDLKDSKCSKKFTKRVSLNSNS
jgi:hypothetical protein